MATNKILNEIRMQQTQCDEKVRRHQKLITSLEGRIASQDARLREFLDELALEKQQIQARLVRVRDSMECVVHEAEEQLAEARERLSNQLDGRFMVPSADTNHSSLLSSIIC
jgi:ABC-type Zn2+ transport system substrate-binding protein/surface adhesin